MDALDISPEAQPQDSSSPPLHSNEGQEQELATHQQSKQDDDMARLPRIPRATDNCPQPMTIDEICDWKYKWKLKRRAPTRSERDDYSECDRQWHDAGSETTDDWEEDEKYMDGMPSPTQRSHPAWTLGYQAERDARKRPLSPPRTPPHLRASKLYTHRDPTLASQPGNSKVQKSKPNTRVAPRRPVTRASGTAAISLHHRKGYVKYWNVPWQYIIISYEQYVKDWSREELDKLPPEPMDFSFESPRFSFNTSYQREVCRRAKAQEKMLEHAVQIPWHHKGYY